MSWVAPREVLEKADAANAVEIGDGVWWVGHHLPDDLFQCHTYLIEHGDQSALIDPGSRLTWPETRRKIEQVVPLEQIRWFVCQHQDPDITAALFEIDEQVQRPDAAIVTHWRAQALIKHYDPKLPFWLVDEHSWRLDLGGRVLRFVMTPYLHFPGAFVTFDESTGILFTSDLFGGFTEDWSLVARDESYFEAIRPFHEHYMPSREILAHGLERLEALPVRMIAPQHGSLIPEPLVPWFVQQLKSLDCGLYLMVDQNTDVRRLPQMNQLLREVTDHLTLSVDFTEIAAGLLDVIRTALPATSIEFYAHDADGEFVRFEPATHYRGRPEPPPAPWDALLGIPRPDDQGTFPVVCAPPRSTGSPGGELVLPLFSPTRDTAEGIAVIGLAEPVALSPATLAALARMSAPIQVALERELLVRSLDLHRQELYQLAVHDSLTGLYNRVYLRDAIERIFAFDNRTPDSHVVLTVFDLDDFKRINDTYGHQAGDEVLRRVAETLRRATREADLAVRLGGDELLLVQVAGREGDAHEVAERLRKQMSARRFDSLPDHECVTVSAGCATRLPGEGFEELLARADRALYRSKTEEGNRLSAA